MTPKRLVLLVEGHGDVAAAPVLVKRLLHEYGALGTLVPDPNPLRVGEYSKISKSGFEDWQRYLRVAEKRGDVGGCLLLLDGDCRGQGHGQSFCAMRAARLLAAEAKKMGAGGRFSVAVVFACMEFESWLIAGAESLAGKPLPDGRREFPECIRNIPADPESVPRDAKGWFRGIMKTGYNPTRDQVELTRMVDFAIVRQRNLRSFRRLESAIQALIGAVRSGTHLVTPAVV